MTRMEKLAKGFKLAVPAAIVATVFAVFAAGQASAGVENTKHNLGTSGRRGWCEKWNKF